MGPIILVIVGGVIFVVLLVVLLGTAARRRAAAEDLEPLLPPSEEDRRYESPLDWPEPAPEEPETAPPAAQPASDAPPISRAPAPEAPVTEIEPPTPSPPTIEVPPRIVEAPPLDIPVRDFVDTPTEAPEKIARRPRFVSRVFSGLAKSRQFFSERLASLAWQDRLGEDAWDEIEEMLIRADVGVEAAVQIVASLRKLNPTPAELRLALENELVRVLDVGDRTLRFAEGGPSVWLVVGVNGTGKTTSVAKIAHRVRSDGHKVIVAAADTFRAAAIDQLAMWADRAGVHMVRHAPGADPGAVVFDALEHARAQSVRVVIADTAGRLHTKSNLMDELKKIRRVAERQAGEIHEVLLVLDATVGQNGIAQARTFSEAVEVTGIVLTKLDGTARGGIVVAVQQELGIPVKFVGVGETLEDLEPFDPRIFAEALLAS